MRQPVCFALICCFNSIDACAADLTAQEVRWLKAAAPVLAFSQTQQLVFDITVQPQAGPNDVALAMGFADGRCKLVLSLRGNPDAEKVLADMPLEQQDLLIETMAAHELGHCWRYAQHAWHALPAGFVGSGDSAARREEAYADLVALAWVQMRHPGQYSAVYRWLSGLRDSSSLSGGNHDTRTWLRLASDPQRLGVQAQPFADVASLWRDGVNLDNPEN
ncbi:hypothetical protein [Massilia sp. S19_KUP03_FR1]|uniref:hypothetical protein n=1 Tax=Massilia sp. S19_KUP03_FR1 TaxID=3025503 RepID=UPI002FCD9CEB